MAAEIDSPWLVRTFAGRTLVASLLVGYFILGYMGVGLTTTCERARSLATALDLAIPVWPAAIYGYGWVYTFMLFPVFLVRHPWLFARTALAYAVVMTAAFATFALFPVSVADLRPGEANLDLSLFHHWALVLNWRLDPVYNCFPSLHVAIATLAALTAHKARPLYGFVGGVVALVIAVSITLVKQHFIVDGIAGIALGIAAYRLVVAGFDGRAWAPREVAYSSRGLGAYLLFHAAVYLGVYAVFVAIGPALPAPVS